jgi:tetratricopeptide (TPR) repeat protein
MQSISPFSAEQNCGFRSFLRVEIMVIDPIQTIDDAWDLLDINDFDRAAVAARSVLSSHPQAIDAFVVLAATCAAPAEAAALLREAVRIASEARSANSEFGQTDLPYDRSAHVRALNNLARLLWTNALPRDKISAIKFARQAIRLDPNDRAGTRFLLISWEASEGNWTASRKMVHNCRKEIRTEVRYWLALHAFREDAPNADALLDKAIATNSHVLAALKGSIVPIGLRSDYCGYGSPDEAMSYAIEARNGWANTFGAIEWLSSRSS